MSVEKTYERMPHLCFEQYDVNDFEAIKRSAHRELIVHSQRPVGSDEVIAAESQALHEAWHDPESNTHVITDAISRRILSKRLPSGGPKDEKTNKTRREEIIDEQVAYGVRLVFSALQYHYWASEHSDPDYPHADKFMDSGFWRQQLEKLFSPESSSREELIYSIEHEDLMSNIPQRSVTVAFLGWLLKERRRLNQESVYPQETYHFLDVGSSLMVGPKKLLAEGSARLFNPPTVRENRRDEKGKYSWIDEEATEAMASIVLGEYAVKDVVIHYGVDKSSVRDEKTAKRARSNSFYAKEIRNKNNVESFDEILRQGKALEGEGKIRFTEADFTYDQQGLFDGQKFDLIFISTMLYQMVPDERKAVLRNARSLLSDDGMLVIQDAAFLDRKDTEWLDFTAKGFGGYFECRTYVLDMMMKERGLQQLGRWKNMRCQEFVFANSRFALEAVKKLKDLA